MVLLRWLGVSELVCMYEVCTVLTKILRMLTSILQVLILSLDDDGYIVTAPWLGVTVRYIPISQMLKMWTTNV